MNRILPPSAASIQDRDLVWRAASDRHRTFRQVNQRHIHPDYISGLERIGFNPDVYPTIDELTQLLAGSGWAAAGVSGYVRTREYASYLAERVFPVSTSVRSPTDIEHSPMPDGIHDILGHLPFLFSARYSGYMTRLAAEIVRQPANPFENELYEVNSALARQERCADNPVIDLGLTKQLRHLQERLAKSLDKFTQLSRLYVWSIEFGVLAAENGLQLLGAGLLSAPGEASGVISGAVPLTKFSSAALSSDINFAEPQASLFVAESFADYERLLDQLTA